MNRRGRAAKSEYCATGQHGGEADQSHELNCATRSSHCL